MLFKIFSAHYANFITSFNPLLDPFLVKVSKMFLLSPLTTLAKHDAHAINIEDPDCPKID